MGGELSRTVEIQISNDTRNFTLENPRTYFNCGFCSVPPRSKLPPHSSDCSRFYASSVFLGVAGILAFEAESFTLAIHFSNPIDYSKYSMELGLELSLSKAHLGSLEDTYARMAERRSRPSTITASDVIALDHHPGTAEVSAGPVKVTATMSNVSHSVIRVVVEEQ